MARGLTAVRDSLAGQAASEREVAWLAEPSSIPSRALSALPALIGLVLGSVASIAERNRALDADALTFQTLANHMTLYNVFGGVREPIWPVLLTPLVHILGDQSALAIRFVGVLGFVALIVVFQVLARHMFGRSWSIAGALLVALTPWLVFQAARGLREETSAALLLLVCLALLQPRISGPRFVLLFALAGTAGLLRWDAMVVMLPVLGLALLLRRPHPVAWIAGPAVLLLLVGPLLLANYVENGDPLYHSNIHARYYRNIEFHDQPGFVTSAQMEVDGFAGPPITWTQYVFGLHSPDQLIERALGAFVVIPARVTTDAAFVTDKVYPIPVPDLVIASRTVFRQYGSLLILFVGMAGAALLLWSRVWVVPMILGEIILLYSPIAGVVDSRLVLPVYPLLVLCVIEAVRTARARLRRRYDPSRELQIEGPQG